MNNLNPLDQYPSVRRFLYMLQWVVNLVLGIIGVVLTAQGLSPQWFIIAGLVWNFFCSYTGLTAQSNTPAPEGLTDTEREADLNVRGE